jgi:nucleoid DNA-binding protein
MNKEKISSQEIIDLVASKASVSKRAAEEFLKVMIATVEDGLLAGEIVKIKNFGTFKLQWNEPRKSVNIQTGTEILTEKTGK